MLQVSNAEDFVFKPPPEVSRARRVLIKPDARYPRPYPYATSRETLERIIAGVRRVSDADIIIIEGNPEGKSMSAIYQALNYRFPRVLTLDVKDSIWVEIESPLSKPYALSSAWVPNVLLSCDFWINVANCNIIRNVGHFTLHNLLGLLPVAKYRWSDLVSLGLDKILADLYFIIPFDLAVLDARQKLIAESESEEGGRIEDYGKIFVGEPYEVAREASQLLGTNMEYLELVRAARVELGI